MRRSRFEITAWIVKDCLLPRRKTHIMYRGNLRFAQTNAYLNLLVWQRLLLHKEGKYETTERGRQFLSVYDQLERIAGIQTSPIGEIRTLPNLSATSNC